MWSSGQNGFSRLVRRSFLRPTAISRSVSPVGRTRRVGDGPDMQRSMMHAEGQRLRVTFGCQRSRLSVTGNESRISVTGNEIQTANFEACHRRFEDSYLRRFLGFATGAATGWAA